MTRQFLQLLALITVLTNSGSAAPSQVNDATQSITIEWMVREFPKYDDSLPRNVSWSPENHLLAYLIATGTEPADLVLFDPVKNATETILTPRTLGGLVSSLSARHHEEKKEDSEKQPEEIPIDQYEWLTERTLRLHADQRVFIYDLHDQSIREIVLPPGEKKDIAYSPDGRFVGYIRDFDLYVYDFDQRREIRLTHGGHERLRNGQLDWVYPEELRISKGFWWSPDGQSIAYLQLNETGVSSYTITDFSPIVPKSFELLYPKAGTQNPHARVGVVRLSNQETCWIDLGAPYEYIARVEWPPGGEFLAIQALNRAQTKRVLLFADPRSGSGRIILEENDPHWVNVQDGPFWVESEKEFIWLSERDGYRHLYRVSQDGKSIKQLTKGEWEVTRVLRVVGNSREIFFETTKNSPAERHVYRVSLSGARIRQITQGSGTHSASVSEDGLYLFDRFTNVRTPNQQAVLTKEGKMVRVLGELNLEDYKPYRFQTPKLFTISADEGRIYHAQLFTPPDFDVDRKYPVILSVYGGPQGQVVRDQFNDMFSQVLATEGFMVFSIDNRGSSGRGHVWETPIHRRLGEIELADHLLGVNYLKSLPYVDPDRIGIWGWSFGGYLTCFAMVKAPDVFRAGAAVAPVTDWRLYDTIYTERYMGHPDDNPEGYHDSSPVYFADCLKGALLLVHGTSDDNVHIQNTYHMIDSLLNANKEYKFYLYPQKSHGIGGDEHQIHLYHRILDFFKSELGDRNDE